MTKTQLERRSKNETIDGTKGKQKIWYIFNGTILIISNENNLNTLKSE